MKTAMQFRGKARPRTPGGFRWHPLVWHSLDGAAAVERLLRIPAFKVVFPASLHRPLVLLAALHDVGKFTRPFQALAPEHWPTVLGPFDGRIAAARHDTLGWQILTDDAIESALLTLLPGSCRYTLMPLLRAVTGHHGRPPEKSDGSLSPKVFCPVCQLAVREWINTVGELLGPSTSLPLTERQTLLLSWPVAGLVNLADWIGSSVPPFEYTEPHDDVAHYWDVARQRAALAVKNSGLEAAPVTPFAGFKALFPSITPSPMQRWAERVELPSGPALVLIEDVTGSGKTEAALTLAHRMMADGRASGLFFALPTMATADAMFARLGSNYRFMFAAGSEPSLVLAHGRRGLHEGFRAAILNEAARPDPPEDDNADDRDSAGPACAAWIADDRRKAFLAEIGAGTIDQALLGALPSRYAALRLLGLSRRVLIVDEAHAYDPYMQAELRALLRFQAALGGCAIVLSATLPLRMRRELADAFRGGQGTTLASNAYPLATIVGAGGTASEHPIEARSARRVPVRRLAEASEAIAEIVRAAADGKAVAWIRNTVDDAIEAAEALRGAGCDVTLFHARFAMYDRAAIERDVMRRFGPALGADRAGVVVATQVIEQSLDLDFDVLVSDLAPIELLIQRAGRVCRHDRGERTAELLVISPEPIADPPADWLAGMRGTVAVYRDPALLWRSARALFAVGVIEAPAGLRALIEPVYAEGAEVPPAMLAAADKARGAEIAQGRVGEYIVLSPKTGYNRDNAAWDDDVRTPTRLTDGMVTVRLARLEDGRVVPWADDTEPARAWALSEVSVREKRLGTPIGDPALAGLVDQARASWPKYQRGIPVLVLAQGAGEWWTAIGSSAGITYHRERAGLRFS